MRSFGLSQMVCVYICLPARRLIMSLNLSDLALDKIKNKSKPVRTEKARSGGQKALAQAVLIDVNLSSA